MQHSTDGVVLRSFPYEENRILTILTREYGVITAFANHANRPRSALAGTTELLCYSDFRLFKTRERYVVDVADSKRIFFGLRSHFENFALASYWAQLFTELSPEGEPAEDFLNLLLGLLHYLEEQSRPALLLKAVAELRLLTLAGYMPDLVGCAHCGVYQADTMYFSLTGALYCGDCKDKLPHAHSYEISPSVLAAMRFIVYSEPRRVYSFTLAEDNLQRLAAISEAYLLQQLGKTLPTLEFYRTLIGTPAPATHQELPPQPPEEAP